MASLRLLLLSAALIHNAQAAVRDHFISAAVTMVTEDGSYGNRAICPG